MYLSHNSFKKHFLGSGASERSMGACSVHNRNCVPHGKTGRNTTIPGCAKWGSTIKEPRTAYSTHTSVCYGWKGTALASLCLLSIPKGGLLEGTYQAQCPELDAEPHWTGGGLQCLSALHLQPKCSHSKIPILSAVNRLVKPRPLSVFIVWARRGKLEEGCFNISTALFWRQRFLSISSTWLHFWEAWNK